MIDGPQLTTTVSRRPDEHILHGTVTSIRMGLRRGEYRREPVLLSGIGQADAVSRGPHLRFRERPRRGAAAMKGDGVCDEKVNSEMTNGALLAAAGGWHAGLLAPAGNAVTRRPAAESSVAWRCTVSREDDDGTWQAMRSGSGWRENTNLGS